jgi:hypothetical protein
MISPAPDNSRPRRAARSAPGAIRVASTVGPKVKSVPSTVSVTQPNTFTWTWKISRRGRRSSGSTSIHAPAGMPVSNARPAAR